MQRGENQDYTINYNTAEVTFTANRLITQDARIQVEFEYADRNYLNVNLYLYDEARIGDKLKLRLGVFSNSDSRNSPINQSLTPDMNQFLAGLGDSIQHAYYPVANIDTFAAGKILYKKIDTTYKNAAGVLVHDSVYVFSANAAVTLYNLCFANVGPGYGNYVPDLNGVNGNVYIWVAPRQWCSAGLVRSGAIPGHAEDAADRHRRGGLCRQQEYLHDRRRGRKPLRCQYAFHDRKEQRYGQSRKIHVSECADRCNRNRTAADHQSWV